MALAGKKKLMYLNTELASRKQVKMLTSKEPPSAGGIHSPLESPQMGQFLCKPKIYTYKL